MQNAQKARIFLALQHYRQNTGNVIDSLAPFFESIIIEMRGQAFEPRIFAEKVQSTFGWNITPVIVEDLIGDFVARGWIERRDLNQNFALFYVKASWPTNFSIVADDSTEREIEQIKNSFDRFIADNPPFAPVVGENFDIIESLSLWLLESGVGTLNALKAAVSNLRRDDYEDISYVIGRFCENAIKNNDSTIDFICDLGELR